MRKWIRRRINDSEMLLFHHRYPTSTVNDIQAAHPFDTGDYFGDTRYILVHNGKIDNPDELRKEHEAKGITYQSVLKNGTYNDSEALLWDVALLSEGKQKDLEAYGDIAFICIKTVKGVPEKMFFARNFSRPLKIFRDKQGLSLSSTGQGEDVLTNRLYTFTYKTRRLIDKYLTVPMYDVKHWEDKDWKPAAPTSSAQRTYGFGSSSDNTCGYNDYGNYDGGYGDDYYDRKYGAGKYAMNGDGKAYYENNTDIYNDADYGIDGDSDDVIDLDDAEFFENTAIRDVSSNEPRLIKDILPKGIAYKPTPEAISTMKFRYIGKAEGSYDQAYWHLYAEREALGADLEVTLLDKLREMKLMSAVLVSILQDQGYINKDSLHPLWLPEEKQQALIDMGAM